MCPNNLFSLILLAAIVLVAATLRKRVSDCARQNFTLLSALIANPQQEFGFTQSRIEGTYKGRKVLMVFPSQKLFMISYPRPTPNTQWRRTRVHFSPPGLERDSYYRVFTEVELKAILDDLNTAAHLVESGQI